MTTSDSASHTPQPIAHLKPFLDRAQTSYNQGNLVGAQNAVARYYRAQMPDGAPGVDRGYAGLDKGWSTLTDQDEAELTPDSVSWNMALNGGGDDAEAA